MTNFNERRRRRQGEYNSSPYSSNSRANNKKYNCVCSCFYTPAKQSLKGGILESLCPLVGWLVGQLVGWLVGLSRFYMDLVRAVTLSFNGGFSNNLAQMFTMMRRRVACKTHVLSSKVKVTLRGQRSNISIMRLVRDRSCLS